MSRWTPRAPSSCWTIASPMSSFATPSSATSPASAFWSVTRVAAPLLSCTARTTIPSTIERHSKAGAAAFVLKMAQPAELVAAIMSAAAGQSSFSPSTMRAVHSVGEVPTARELAVLERLARGQSTAEIAAALGIRPRTVDGHLGSLFDRVGVGGRTELVLHAVREGWIRPKPSDVGRPTDGGRSPAGVACGRGLAQGQSPRAQVAEVAVSAGDLAGRSPGWIGTGAGAERATVDNRAVRIGESRHQTCTLRRSCGRPGPRRSRVVTCSGGQ